MSFTMKIFSSKSDLNLILQGNGVMSHPRQANQVQDLKFPEASKDWYLSVIPQVCSLLIHLHCKGMAL